MGVDWIPCRVEPGITREEIDRAMELEALHFQAMGGTLPCDLLRLVHFEQAEKDRIIRSYRENGMLRDRLLFKYESHRVSVVGSKALFPLEWRLDAWRTIPPWELPAQVEKWRAYRQAVADGRYDSYLMHLLAYDRSVYLADYFDGDIQYQYKRSEEATGSWARNPDSIAVRAEFATFQRPEPISPPVWMENPAVEHGPDGAEYLALIGEETTRVNGLIERWNRAVKRGNYQIRRVEAVPSVESWIHTEINDAWFASFLDWVKPFVDGGYGLYRDCE